ncbi:flagellar hook-length control protein FliK [Mucispirillum schaedleri]|uniref:flagellar hook-length control protein FliK n=1 Tax=Mucispirillum schaedleri TaxID=248039 RepID=UPI001F59DA74|nr:flagellar hook-length control protein FliK [Mucispirillum schaedleri]
MMNFNTVNKANTAQSLLPSFSETTDISGKSFQSIFKTVKDNSYDNSLNPYSRDNNDYNSRDDKRYSQDKENYEAVERAVYRDDSPSSKNIKDTNTIQEQNIFERKDFKAVQNSQAETGSNKGIVYNQEIVSNQDMQLEANQEDTISFKDILALLQTTVKNNTGEESANEESAAQENINLLTDTNTDTNINTDINNNININTNTNTNTNDDTLLQNINTTVKNNTGEESANEESAAQENINLLTDTNTDTNINTDINNNININTNTNTNTNTNDDTLLQNINTAVSELNIPDDLKIKFHNFISLLKNIEQPDLQGFVEYIGALSEDINISDINVENISLEEISEKILGVETDSGSLEKAYTALQEKISEFTNLPKESYVDIVETEKTEIKDIITSLTNDKPENTEIINNLSALIDEAVKETALPSNNEKLELAKNIITVVKAAAENILSQPDTVSSDNILENTSAEKEAVVIDNEISGDYVKQTAQLDEDNTLFKQSSDKKILQDTAKDTFKDVVTENMQDSAKESAKKIVKETLKDVVKEIMKDTIKDTAKQADTISVKDVQKEFKTANVEVTESLRGEHNAKAEIKAQTVNLAETDKNLQNNLNQKEMMMVKNNAEENFSTSQNDKGNNFNYFLKSSAEVQSKYDTAQSKETQAPYNMKEPRDIERLVRTMQSSVSKGQSKLTVVLTPENLGRMQIQLSESGGKITAKFLSDNESSHKLIMAQSDLLKNQLSEKGIVVDNMEFAFNDAMSKQQNNDEHGRKTSKQNQKGKNFRNQEDNLEVGTEVANNKPTGIYA